MKKFYLGAIVALTLFSCSQPQKPQEQSGSSPADSATAAAAGQAAEMKTLYEKNLATLKTNIASFENEQVDAWGTTVADNVAWHSPAYGDMDSSKAHWKETLMMYAANWDSIHLVNPIFLPGIDQKTQTMDGSVRYYGEWRAVHKSGKRTVVNFYGTYDFDQDGKISQASEFFDVGGLMKAVGMK